jgi:phospholipid/cholesterol/gamma-HCH transport system permease protein
VARGPSLRAGVGADGDLLSAEGDWTGAHAADLDRLAHAAPAHVRKLTINLDGVGRLDTFGVWALERLRRQVVEAGAEARLAIPQDARADLFAGVDKALALPSVPGGRRDRWGTLLQRMCRSAEAFAVDFAAFLDLTGRLTFCFAQGLRHPARLRLRSAMHHLDRTGLRAVPIIALMCFLIGCILAQQGFFHFQRFGATDYVVDLVTILVLREIGVLLVTIMVAGRSGSAYTAEIGSMKMREEIDALRTMGLDPVEYLILPRILALIVAAPLLTVIGNAAALYGAGVVAWIYGDMSPAVYIERLHEAASHIDLEVGLIKAPVMAFVIGAVAALEGMKVQGSAESLGLGATASVVRSIFFVIVLDGIFAVLFAAVGM